MPVCAPQAALVSFLFGLMSWMGPSQAQSQPQAKGSNHGGIPALYPTKAEAEKAASRFGCSGAHRMGDRWMPCASHGATSVHAHP